MYIQTKTKTESLNQHNDVNLNSWIGK